MRSLTPCKLLKWIKSNFKAALIPGLDTDEFADMYAQTLAYGLFAARVAQTPSP